MTSPTGNDAVKCGRGFTLVELLVAAAIAGLVIIAIGAVLGAGIRTWLTVRNHLRVEATAMLGLAMWERDIMNAEPFLDRPFQGDSHAMSVPVGLPPVRTETLAGQAGFRASEPGFVDYRFDADARVVMRETGLIERAGISPAVREAWIPNVDALRLRYRADLPAMRVDQSPGDLPDWQDRWDHPLDLPAAVWISMRLSLPAEPPVNVERIIVLPRGHRQGGRDREVF